MASPARSFERLQGEVCGLSRQRQSSVTRVFVQVNGMVQELANTQRQLAESQGRLGQVCPPFMSTLFSHGLRGSATVPKLSN